MLHPYRDLCLLNLSIPVFRSVYLKSTRKVVTHLVVSATLSLSDYDASSSSHLLVVALTWKQAQGMLAYAGGNGFNCSTSVGALMVWLSLQNTENKKTNIAIIGTDNDTDLRCYDHPWGPKSSMLRQMSIELNPYPPAQANGEVSSFETPEVGQCSFSFPQLITTQPEVRVERYVPPRPRPYSAADSLYDLGTLIDRE
ncbi:uncharacterized protein PAC_05845 [Phialocephala subalpina]|uniref:Uncharacterized protein n=1 Tax=Phialocephala subalpina TaxID=576137 RepID=A0A1L7WT64_9HELO|nr:uncharacterized protein PAC_05845 [Phialocephala subalpina]